MQGRRSDRITSAGQMRRKARDYVCSPISTTSRLTCIVLAHVVHSVEGELNRSVKARASADRGEDRRHGRSDQLKQKDAGSSSSAQSADRKMRLSSLERDAWCSRCQMRVCESSKSSSARTHLGPPLLVHHVSNLTSLPMASRLALSASRIADRRMNSASMVRLRSDDHRKRRRSANGRIRLT